MRKIARGGAGVGSLPKRKGHGGAQRRRGRGKGKVFHRMWQNEDPEKSEFYTVSTEFSTVFCEKSRFKRVKIEKSENCGIFPKAEKGEEHRGSFSEKVPSEPTQKPLGKSREAAALFPSPPSEREGDHEVVEGACGTFPFSLVYHKRFPHCCALSFRRVAPAPSRREPRKKCVSALLAKTALLLPHHQLRWPLRPPKACRRARKARTTPTRKGRTV